jgi:general secretion pathway protein L
VADLVLIRFSQEQAGHYEWLITDKRGSPVGAVGRGTGDALADACRKRQAVLLLPGADVLLTQARLPVRSAAAIAKALPYALEEQLADEVETLHFVRGPQDVQGNMPVAVIQRQRLERYLAELQQIGVRPERAYPVPLLLPRREGAWSILVEGEQVMVRSGDYQGMGLERDCLLPVLRQLLEGQEARPVLQLWAKGEAMPNVDEWAAIGCEVEPMPALSSGLPLLASGLAGPQLLDLLPGVSAGQAGAMGPVKAWRAVAAFLLLALLIQFGGMGYGYWLLQAEESVLRQEVEETFKTAFPEVRRIVNPRIQADQQLAEMRRIYGQGGDAFLSLLYVSGQELQKGNGLQITDLSFKGGVLQLRLQGRDLSQFEGLKQRLEQHQGQRLEVTILSAQTRNEGVDARIQIKGQAS